MQRAWLPIAVRQMLTCASSSTNPRRERDRGAGAAGCDLGGAEGHLQLARELEPVFEAMLENATASATPSSGACVFAKARLSRGRAAWRASQRLSKQRTREPVIARLLELHSDVWSRPSSRSNCRCALNRLSEQSGVHRPRWRRRTVLTVPMLKEGELIGAFIIYRQEVRPFTENRSSW